MTKFNTLIKFKDNTVMYSRDHKEAFENAKSKGLNIPKDLAIAGFTDGLISEYSSPAITTIAQHGLTMGRQAVDLLIERIENESADFKAKRIVISSDLKVRESTKTSS